MAEGEWPPLSRSEYKSAKFFSNLDFSCISEVRAENDSCAALRYPDSSCSKSSHSKPRSSRIWSQWTDTCAQVVAIRENVDFTIIN